MPDATLPPSVAVIGAGPAGLMAAEILATAGLRVTVFDRMPSPARKFLMAGRGGLNLTHSETLDAFLTRYRPAASPLLDAVRAFPPAALIAWCEGLGVPTFVGSSGRVFPKPLKASPLLRAWLARIGALGVELRPRHAWTGFDAAGAPRFATPAGEFAFPADAMVLALGGASWPRLGSDGGWAALLPEVPVTPFAPSNVGFAIDWSAKMAAQAGQPLKRIALSFAGTTIRGEAMLTRTGIEGGAIYALSAPIRDAIARDGQATFTLDLRPDLPAPEIARRLSARGKGETITARLRKGLGLDAAAVALVQEALHGTQRGADPARLVKALPLTTRAPQGMDRAISSAGGIAWAALDERFMLRTRPGTFACGEMLDWEAPTGGYLLQACFATGAAAAAGVLGWVGACGAVAGEGSALPRPHPPGA